MTIQAILMALLPVPLPEPARLGSAASTTNLGRRIRSSWSRTRCARPPFVPVSCRS